jgi:uncharacterized cupredoxin-like copper-binding protein
MNHQLENNMKKTIKLALALAALSNAPARAHEHHGHETFSAGEPGDPRKPARTIEIAMSEMAYEPSSIAVKRGEQIRFVLRNAGSEDHEFLLATIRTEYGSHRRRRPRSSGSSPRPARSNFPA